MYAVFEDGSRQYKVSEGDKVKVDYRELDPGSRIEFNRVLLYAEGESVQIGQPTVEGARIVAEVVAHPSTKIYVQHFRRRKNYRRLRGHRQPYTKVQIRNILLGDQKPAKSEEPNPKSEEPSPKHEEPSLKSKEPSPKSETRKPKTEKKISHG